MCIPVERQSAGGAQRSAGSGRRIARRSHAGRDRVALWFAVPVVGQASGHVLHARVCHLPPASCSFPAAAARIVAPRPRHAPSRASRNCGMLQSPELRREQRDNVASRSIISITMRALLGIKPCLQSFGSPVQVNWLTARAVSVQCLLLCTPQGNADRAHPLVQPLPGALAAHMMDPARVHERQIEQCQRQDDGHERRGAREQRELDPGRARHVGEEHGHACAADAVRWCRRASTQTTTVPQGADTGGNTAKGRRGARMYFTYLHAPCRYIH